MHCCCLRKRCVLKHLVVAHKIFPARVAYQQLINFSILADNLKLFHELQGPVFSGPGIRLQDMPEGMPPKPLIDFHQHPGLFDMFNADD